MFFGMRFVCRVIGKVSLRKGSVPYHEQILSIFAFSSAREIERIRDDHRFVHNDDLIVRDRVLGIDESRNARMGNEIGR